MGREQGDTQHAKVTYCTDIQLLHGRWSCESHMTIRGLYNLLCMFVCLRAPMFVCLRALMFVCLCAPMFVCLRAPVFVCLRVPRDGSAVELVGLCYSTVTFLAKMNQQSIYPHSSVKLPSGGSGKPHPLPVSLPLPMTSHRYLSRAPQDPHLRGMGQAHQGQF